MKARTAEAALLRQPGWSVELLRADATGNITIWLISDRTRICAYRVQVFNASGSNYLWCLCAERSGWVVESEEPTEWVYVAVIQRIPRPGLVVARA